jgi:hypothetical protein
MRISRASALAISTDVAYQTTASYGLIQGNRPGRHALPRTKGNESTRVREGWNPRYRFARSSRHTCSMTLSGTFPGGCGHEIDAGRLFKGENATGNQPLLLLRATFQTAGNDPRHGLIAVADKHLFAVANQLNMGAELRFQIADIDSSHAPI